MIDRLLLGHRFDIKFEGLKVLDLFTGSGALGIEYYSRGAEITFVDNESYRERRLSYLKDYGNHVLDLH